jgi:hypothetical protein
LHKGTPSALRCVSGSPGAAPPVFSSWHSLPRSPGLSSGSPSGTHLTVQHCRESRDFQEEQYCYDGKLTVQCSRWSCIAWH